VDWIPAFAGMTPFQHFNSTIGLLFEVDMPVRL
jgi:hypothetical protein